MRLGHTCNARDRDFRRPVTQPRVGRRLALTWGRAVLALSLSILALVLRCVMVACMLKAVIMRLEMVLTWLSPSNARGTARKSLSVIGDICASGQEVLGAQSPSSPLRHPGAPSPSQPSLRATDLAHHPSEHVARRGRNLDHRADRREGQALYASPPPGIRLDQQDGRRPDDLGLFKTRGV
jgi:hypothetical protein